MTAVLQTNVLVSNDEGFPDETYWLISSFDTIGALKTAPTSAKS